MKLAKIKVYKFQVLPIVNINGHNSSVSKNGLSTKLMTPTSHFQPKALPTLDLSNHLSHFHVEASQSSQTQHAKTMVLTTYLCCQPTRPAVLPISDMRTPSFHLLRPPTLTSFSCQTSQSASKCCQLALK